MTSLLGGKTIVGISIFLLITLLYLTGQFSFDATSFTLPQIKNPFEIQMNVKPIITTDTSAMPYEQIVSKWAPRYQEALQPQRQAIENADCELLQKQYNINTGWELRPYVKYRMIQLNC